MPWPRRWMRRFCSRAMTSRKPICSHAFERESDQPAASAFLVRHICSPCCFVYGGGPDPGKGARPADGTATEAHAAAAEGSTAAAGRGPDAQGPGEKLQRGPGDDFEARSMTGAGKTRLVDRRRR
jgi:hypothetical protein